MTDEIAAEMDEKSVLDSPRRNQYLISSDLGKSKQLSDVEVTMSKFADGSLDQYSDGGQSPEHMKPERTALRDRTIYKSVFRTAN
jgi:hypothetical protein